MKREANSSSDVGLGLQYLGVYGHVQRLLIRKLKLPANEVREETGPWHSPFTLKPSQTESECVMWGL